MLKATKRLIDSVWTLGYEFTNDGKITILSYNREDVEGYNKERELLRCSIIESDDNKRTALKVVLAPYAPFKSWASPSDPDSKVYEISNPKNIFSYGN